MPAKIYYRRRLLLSILEISENFSMDRIAMQKILFKISQFQIKHQIKPSFSFVPYKQGCFSFQAAKDLNVMRDFYGLLSEDDGKTWVMKRPASNSTNKYFDDLLDIDKTAVQKAFTEMDLSDPNKLIHDVYDSDPYFAINSEREGLPPSIRKKISIARNKVQANNTECLFSIGYEGRCIDKYLNLLIENNISLLCDVRKNPVSMKYGFSKKQLADKCGKLKIGYLHIPALGIDSSDRANLSDAASYEKLFAGYSISLNNKEDALDSVLDELHNHKRIALTCFEADHKFCHRSSITSFLSNNNSINIHHL
ncbi:MAG: DUF488 domain-containing protein [Gammaproteobacteria bacterium]|nr:DUF488 domain-containing protein [Gammaproteobacteria bacterium]